MADFKAAVVGRDVYTTEEDDDETLDSGAAAIKECSSGKHRTGVGSVEVPKKPRGRPPGSKNKPKPPIVITHDSESAMRLVVLELSAGCDVVEGVATFARRRHVGICILSGSGSVANVTLRHPTSISATLTLHGRFDILSLSGTFLSDSSSASSSSMSSFSAKSPLTISLAGAQGQVIGGSVTGSLLAAGPIILTAASFINPSFHRLPSDDEETRTNEHEPVSGTESANDSMSMFVCSVAAHIPINCLLPPDVTPY
ncbi:AT-hook motif nuclear-localized protein 28-like [Aristolochia californica]|uniref:AT-hook motif nuclear-localized protein 28-like n=1 Tax=Aristolochia californica TaxID=171875 RepID=UPI0035DC9655